MDEPATYESFPTRIVLLSALVSIAIYAIGLYLMAGLGLWAALAYLVYCGWMEYRLLRHSCVNCTYYGQTCAFGKGRVCSWLFRQGSPERFGEREIS